MPSIPTSGTLNERLANVSGKATMRFTDEVELTISEDGATVLGAIDLQEIVIDGENKGIITAKGGKQSIVQAPKDGLLTFKNLTLNDETVDGQGNWTNYLYFGGRLRFENVTVTDSIYLDTTTEATFVGCTFISSQSQQYSVWVGNGTATFEDCTFEGYRGLKIHEFTDEQQDVETVSVTDCTFKNLTEKVGIAIGVMDKQTTITVKESCFWNCRAWDKSGSLVGVNGFYECDTPLEEFTFVECDNEIFYDALNDDSNWTKFY